MDRQLAFELPNHTSLDKGDFFVSQSNEIAVNMIEDWQNWPLKKHFLSGPKSSGKSHLAHVWAKISDANIISADHLKDPEMLASGNIVIENIDKIVGQIDMETDLFHTHNLIFANQHFLLMTGLSSPSTLQFALPDLASRLEGTRLASLKEPDDMLFSALLAKLFADRQLSPAPDVIQYLITRLERSHAAAKRFVQIVDKAALNEHKSITRAFVVKILAKITPIAD
ncbi:DnaA/Hda family protein [Paracoccaceae bacterium]|jgi:chromosomal replication initiation ATPase DnaA|nr:DnaA/Hda family protein [Paracoccaceae bacterium]